MIIILDFKMFYILTKNIIFLTRSFWIESKTKVVKLMTHFFLVVTFLNNS